MLQGSIWITLPAPSIWMLECTIGVISTRSEAVGRPEGLRYGGRGQRAEHQRGELHSSALICCSKMSFTVLASGSLSLVAPGRPRCFWQTRPSREMMNDIGRPNSGP